MTSLLRILSASTLAAAAVFACSRQADSQPEDPSAPAQTVSEAERRWTARGGLLTTDIPRNQRVPDDENAALVYAAAQASLAEAIGYDGVGSLGEEEVFDNVESLRPILESCAEALTLAERAGRMERSQYNESVEEMADNAEIIVGDRDLFRLLKADLRVALADNDEARITRAALSCLRLARHKAADADVLSLLIAAAFSNSALTMLAEHSCCGTIPPATRAALRAELETADWEAWHLAALRRDLPYTLEMFEDFTSDGDREELDAFRLIVINQQLALLDYFESPRHLRPEKPAVVGDAANEEAADSVDSAMRAYRTLLSAQALVQVTLAAVDALDELPRNDGYPTADEYRTRRTNPFTGESVEYAPAGTGFAVWVQQPEDDRRMILWLCR